MQTQFKHFNFYNYILGGEQKLYELVGGKDEYFEMYKFLELYLRTHNIYIVTCGVLEQFVSLSVEKASWLSQVFTQHPQPDDQAYIPATNFLRLTVLKECYVMPEGLDVIQSHEECPSCIMPLFSEYRSADDMIEDVSKFTKENKRALLKKHHYLQLVDDFLKLDSLDGWCRERSIFHGLAFAFLLAKHKGYERPTSCLQTYFLWIGFL